ncbi:MAG: tetratricopeptide repeat protein [Candidatus Gastranaerophilales bacterium]|nr:tetratricopeptide repeat protein [Candidatus Gastranaerophilales bacterium]
MKKAFGIAVLSALFIFNSTICFCEEYKPLAIKKHNEGVAFYDKKQYTNAIECFIEATQEDPSFVDSYYNLGVLYEYFGNDPKAMAAYKQLLRLDPYNPQAAYKIAKMYAKEKNYKVALKYLSLVPKSSPVYSAAQELQTKLCATLGKEQHQYNAFEPASNGIAGVLSPSGVVKDTLGNLYVSSYSQNSITVINESTKRIYARGSFLAGPMGLAVDSYNNLYVACYNSGRVILVSPDGAYQIILSGLKKPQDLYIDNENILYVTERGNNKLIQYKLY